MKNIEYSIAESLLQIKAIKLSTTNFFTWASGWHSPIYCDNRMILSFPDVRRDVYESFSRIISKNFKDVDIIAGVATGAIAHGALVAEYMEKPFIYVRSAPKGHGLANQIEGSFKAGQKVVVIEDLISTGGSSLSAVEALRSAGCQVVGMVAIFSYGFEIAKKAFQEAGVELFTLSNYETLIKTAVKDGYIKDDEMKTLLEWRQAPDKWNR